MKENPYDNAVFFAKYAQMPRSQKGLEGAAEWRSLSALMPDFHGKRVLDLGCGYGWHCLYAVQHGASSVLGVDLSSRMLKVAKQKHADKRITYQCAAMEDLCLDQEAFDIVISSLAFHYVEDYEGLINNIGRWLKPGGYLVFSVEHPTFTAYGSQDWIYDENGTILHFPVDNYYYEGKREAIFLGERTIKYHRTLTTYLDTLLTHGFALRRIVEPFPDELMRQEPAMKEEMRRPMMLLVKAQKHKGHFAD